ncbi:hypothetical protein, partial [Bacteroides sp. 51]|uniref:hypothetical protein n=1 Tax=Bacteroides sp. 51 TaxID=2302938 RepID=UPI0019403411
QSLPRSSLILSIVARCISINSLFSFSIFYLLSLVYSLNSFMIHDAAGTLLLPEEEYPEGGRWWEQFKNHTKTISKQSN